VFSRRISISDSVGIGETPSAAHPPDNTARRLINQVRWSFKQYPL
jgi:hypothetical protein